MPFIHLSLLGDLSGLRGHIGFRLARKKEDPLVAPSLLFFLWDTPQPPIVSRQSRLPNLAVLVSFSLSFDIYAPFPSWQLTIAKYSMHLKPFSVTPIYNGTRLCKSIYKNKTTVSWRLFLVTYSSIAKGEILDISIDTLVTLPRLKQVSATKQDIINACNESIRLQVTKRAKLLKKHSN